MKVGDIVRWCSPGSRTHPLAIVVMASHATGPDSPFFRIRVMWLGENIPTQAEALSVRKDSKRISAWVYPKYFEVFNEAG